MPEGFIPIAHAVTYLSSSPKSNTSYIAYLKAKEDVKTYGYLDIPKHIINPVTDIGKELGYGNGYQYPHDYEGGYVKQQYLPDKLKGKHYYTPKDIGYEKIIKAYLDMIRQK
jgi:putative ATPase